MLVTNICHFGKVLSRYIFLFRLIDPQTQVTRLRVRWSLFLCFDSFIFRQFLVIYHLLSPPAVPSLHCGSVFISSGQQEAVWFRSAAGRRAGRQPSRLLHLRIQQRWREGRLCVHLLVCNCLTIWLVCLTCLSSSCVSDMWQYRSGQADSLPLWDGETEANAN